MYQNIATLSLTTVWNCKQSFLFTHTANEQNDNMICWQNFFVLAGVSVLRIVLIPGTNKYHIQYILMTFINRNEQMQTSFRVIHIIKATKT
jgi:hypothetical protein